MVIKVAAVVLFVAIIMDFFLLSYCSSLLTITAFSSGGPCPSSVAQQGAFGVGVRSSESCERSSFFGPLPVSLPRKNIRKCCTFTYVSYLLMMCRAVLHAMVSMLYLIRICVAVIYLEGLNTLPPLVVTTEETSSKYLHPP